MILHVELEQVPVALLWLHFVPQPPQLFGSSVTLTSQPLSGLPSQSLNPVLHAVITHFDVSQLSVALFVLQTLPQPPQFLGSFVVLVSQPLLALLSQLAVPATVHFEISQLPFVHTSVAPAAEQALPHEPQWLVLFSMSVSQPFEALLSQLP